jgi:hypothetical protein
MSYKKDGTDHVLVSPFANTNVGKISSLSWRGNFFIPGLGEFSSPINFAVWCATGDESFRKAYKVTPPKIPTVLWTQSRLYAKYAQLCALKKFWINEYEGLKSLPWLSYKSHDLGVREYLRDNTHNIIIKGFMASIASSTKPDWESEIEGFNLPKVKQEILAYMKDTWLVTEESE